MTRSRKIDIEAVSHVLSDPRRARILDLLAAARRDGACCSPENPDVPDGLCACDLAPALDDMAPSKLAYHLGQLRACGLVSEQPRGRWVYYTLDRDVLARYAEAVRTRWVEPPARRRRRA